MYVKSNNREWDVHIHEFRHAINCARQSTTRLNPVFLNLELHPKLVKSLRRETEGVKLGKQITPEVWLDRIKILEVLRDMVINKIECTGDKQERRCNKGKIQATFNISDMVMRRVHMLLDASKKFNPKLAPKIDGLFQITEVKSLSV